MHFKRAPNAGVSSAGFRRFTRMTGLLLGAAACVLVLLGYFEKVPSRVGFFCAVLSVLLGAMSFRQLQGYLFTACILICVSAAMLFPDAFIQWNGFKLERLIVPLTQLIMFGMGATLSLKDFARVARSPLPILLGFVLQFSVMPFLGFLIAHIFGFEGEIAAGIILIGSCSGGMASNLMTYLAGGNLALSVTMTFCSTLVSPLLTPVLMQVLAGKFVPIDSLAMMFSILNMIILPLIAGLVAHKILYSKEPWVEKGNVLILLAVTAILLSLLAFMFSGILGPFSTGVILGSALISVVSIIKLIMSVWLRQPDAWIDRLLPFVSMAGICTILTIIIAQTYDVLIAVGSILLIAAVIHNGLGYTLGYWTSRALGTTLGSIGYRLRFFETPVSRISESESRTIAIEVGMQNGGMATGLAIDVLQSYVAALPPNLFGTWMNISGSMLANYWHQRPTRESAQTLSRRGSFQLEGKNA